MNWIYVARWTMWSVQRNTMVKGEAFGAEGWKISCIWLSWSAGGARGEKLAPYNSADQLNICHLVCCVKGGAVVAEGWKIPELPFKLFQLLHFPTSSNRHPASAMDNNEFGPDYEVKAWSEWVLLPSQSQVNSAWLAVKPPSLHLHITAHRTRGQRSHFASLLTLQYFKGQWRWTNY